MINLVFLLASMFILLICVLHPSIETFYLSRELVDKYMKIKEKELTKQYSRQAWDHCQKLMRLQLKWSPDEKEVCTIESKEFPCGNTVEKCLIKTMKELREGKRLRPIMNQQIDEYLNDEFYA